MDSLILFSMTEKRFLQLSLLLPLLLPAIAYLIIRVGIFPESVHPLLFLLVTSGLLAFVPYTLLAIIIMVLLRKRPSADWLKVALIFPLLLSLVPLLGFALFSDLSAGGYYALWVLGFGYFYVMLTFVLNVLLKRTGFIRLLA